jgi:p-cumate 2,3-dioxygenase beta subunit
MSDTFTNGALSSRMLMRLRVEEFLFGEAALLDSWQLDEWLTLFREDATYVVPSTDRPGGDPRTDLTLIDDDYLRLTWRVNRLKSRHAHREFPWSRTRRQISNVRVVERSGDEVNAEACVVVHRFRHGHRDSFIGLYRYRLVDVDESFLIVRRRAELDLERLSPNGALSMVF